MNANDVDLIYTKIFSKLCPEINNVGKNVKDAKDSDFIKDKDNLGERKSQLEISEPKRYSRQLVIAEIPRWEAWFYNIYCVTTVLIAGYSIYLFSIDIEKYGFYNYNIYKGWTFIGRKKDHASGQWHCLYVNFYKLTAIVFIHIVSSLLARRYLYHHRRCVWMVIGMLTLMWVSGWKCVVFTIGNVVAFYGVSRTRSVILCYSLGLGIIAITNSYFYTYIGYLDLESMDETYFFSWQFSFLLMRIYSFAIDSTFHHSGKSDLDSTMSFTFFDLLSYTFYTPYLFTGPVFTYRYFQPQVLKPKRDWEKSELFYIAQKFTRVVFVLFAMDGLLHVLYVHTIGYDLDLLQRISPMCMAGIVLYTGCLYQSMCTVVYGLPACLMRLDHIVPPTNPRCIIRVAEFNDHWRYFDPGLHAFFRNYIYIPIGGSRRGIHMQILGAFASFLFVWYWHGARGYLFTYFVVNFTASVLDILSKNIMRSDHFIKFQEKYLSAAIVRRLFAVYNVPIFALSTYSIMIFFIDGPQAWTMVDRLLVNGSAWTIFLTCFSLYCGTMFSIEIGRLENECIFRKKTD